MVLDSNDFADVIDAGLYAVHIQRLDGVHVNDSGGNAFLCQFFCRPDCQNDGIAVGNQRHVGAVLNLDGFADFELLILIVDYRNRIPGEPQIHRSVDFCRLANQGFGRIVIRRHDHSHVRNGTENAHVFDALMAGAVVGRSQAAVGASDFYVQVGVANFLTNLFRHPEGTEYRIGYHEWNFSRGGQSRRNAGAVLFCNTHVQMLHRQLLTKLLSLTGFTDIDIHNVDILVFFTQCYDFFAETDTSGNFLFCIHYRPPSSFIAISYSSSFGALPCQPSWFSM